MTLQIRRSAGTRVTRENRPRRTFVMSVHGYSRSQKCLHTREIYNIDCYNSFMRRQYCKLEPFFLSIMWNNEILGILISFFVLFQMQLRKYSPKYSLFIFVKSLSQKREWNDENSRAHFSSKNRFASVMDKFF